MTDKVQKIKDWINREQDVLMDAQGNFDNPSDEGAFYILTNLDYYIDSLQEEPVSKDFEMALAEMIDKAQKCVVEPWVVAAQWKDELIKLASEEFVSEELDEYINELSKQFPEVSFAKLSRIAVRAAKWQKANLWKSADGDDLPEIDREVVAFQEIFPTDVDVPSLLKIVIAHRPNPEGYDGKSITTGQVEHYTPKTYGKGGWNIPDVKYWLDVKLPKEIRRTMSEAEKFIQDYTRNCSNEILSPYPQINNDVRKIDGEPAKEFSPWLTPDQARKAVEIAKEEMINEICEWIGKQKELLEDSFSDPNDFADILKQAMRDE